jgi:hypothetical protein
MLYVRIESSFKKVPTFDSLQNLHSQSLKVFFVLLPSMILMLQSFSFKIYSLPPFQGMVADNLEILWIIMP